VREATTTAEAARYAVIHAMKPTAQEAATAWESAMAFINEVDARPP
jgi:hypothetical protein